MLNKKGLTLTELVELIIALFIIVGILLLITKLLHQPESQTLNSFKTLNSEIKLIVKDLQNTNKTEITVPIYVEAGKAISAVNKDSTVLYSDQCKGKSCLELYEKTTLKITNVIPLDNLEFKQEAHIQAPQNKIINVKVTAEKINSKTIITLEQLP